MVCKTLHPVVLSYTMKSFPGRFGESSQSGKPDPGAAAEPPKGLGKLVDIWKASPQIHSVKLCLECLRDPLHAVASALGRLCLLCAQFLTQGRLGRSSEKQPVPKECLSTACLSGVPACQSLQ